MMRQITGAVLVLAVASLIAVRAFAHCEIPCGIYDDEVRIKLIAEHITTIEKGMKQIEALSKEAPLNHNQLVRWIENKDHHANEIQHIVTQYFMTQRVKLVDKNDEQANEDYVRKLTLLHEMLVYAMKAKQTTDLGNIEKLRSVLDEFRTVYFGES